MIMAFHLSIGDLFAALGRGGSGLVRLFTATEEEPTITPDGAAVKPRRPRLSAEEDGLPADVPRINPRGRVDDRRPRRRSPRWPNRWPPPRTCWACCRTRLPPPHPPAPRSPGKKGKASAVAADGSRAAVEVAKQLPLPVAGPSGMIWKLPETRCWSAPATSRSTTRDLRAEGAQDRGDAGDLQASRRSVREINPGAGRDAVRARAGRGRQGPPHHGAGERPGPGAGRASHHASRRRSPASRASGIESPTRRSPGRPARDDGDRRISRAARPSCAIALGRDVNGRYVVADLAKHAAPADRRRDRLRQVGLHQLAIISTFLLTAHAGRTHAADDRPEDGRAESATTASRTCSARS